MVKRLGFLTAVPLAVMACQTVEDHDMKLVDIRAPRRPLDDTKGTQESLLCLLLPIGLLTDGPDGVEHIRHIRGFGTEAGLQDLEGPEAKPPRLGVLALRAARNRS